MSEYSPIQDGLGSVRGVVDATGTTAASHNYSPYGEPDAPLSGFAFTGEQRDTNGLQCEKQASQPVMGAINHEKYV